jgi:hypothetical protein
MNTTYTLFQYDPDEAISCPRLGRFGHITLELQIEGMPPCIGETIVVRLSPTTRYLRVTHIEHGVSVNDGGPRGCEGIAGPVVVYAVRA